MKKIQIQKNENIGPFDYIGKNMCKKLFEAVGLYAYYRAKVIRNIDKDVIDIIKQSYNKRKLICFTSLDTLSNKINKDVRTLEKWQNELENHGWIIINRYRGYYVIELGSYKIIDGEYIEEYYAEKYVNSCSCDNDTEKETVKIVKENKRSYKTVKQRMAEIEEKDRQEREANRIGKDYKFPSTLARNKCYKTRPIDKWIPSDFIGLYLNLYTKTYDMEDVAFVGLKEGIYPKFYKLVKNTLEKVFDKNKKELKDYVEWAFDFVSKSDWIDMITVSGIFSQSSYIMKQYAIKNKVKGKKDKVDNNFSDNDNVMDYLKKKGKLKV